MAGRKDFPSICDRRMERTKQTVKNRNNHMKLIQNKTSSEGASACAVPTDWWVTGAIAREIYLFCSRTAMRGVVLDASPSELERAERVDITCKFGASIPDVSYRWEEHARVRVVELPSESGGAAIARRSLVRLLRCPFREMEPASAVEARRAAIEAMESLIMRLDRLECIPWIREIIRVNDHDIPF